MVRIISIITFFFCATLGLAQTDGMSYQAVVIGPAISEIPGVDLSDNVLQNANITVQFTISDETGTIEYQETHETMTDAEGMFHLMIGKGNPLSGVYTEILWYGEPKNLKVEIDIGEGLVDFEEKPILFTPHAYHRDVLATGDMRVDGATNFQNDFELDGILLLNNSLEVANEAATKFTGTLQLEGDASLNNDVLVANGSPTELSGTLHVDGVTNLNEALTVANTSATDLSGNLNVNESVLIDNTLQVNGSAILDSVRTHTLAIQNTQDEFIAVMENLNGADGDGLVIKLGKTPGAWDGSDYLNLDNPVTTLLDGPTGQVRSWLDGGTFEIQDLLNVVPAELIAESMISLTNLLIDNLNKEVLHLPIRSSQIQSPRVNLLPATTFFPGLSGCTPQACFRICFFGGCSSWCVPPWRVCANVPSLSIPEIYIPEITFVPADTELVPAIPFIPSVTGDSIAFPVFRANSVVNSLTEENQYMTFEDKDGRQTGAIKAQSVVDFRNNTLLDNLYVLNVTASFIGIDKLDAFVSGVVEISNLIDEYNHIGVEYSSGNGDYAEWLEREDIAEYLTAGDIVAVRGGRISKNLEGAEQLMVVSHKPIVMGNAPQERNAYLGNTVAFIGQVPAKVVGPVRSGDYIVADTVIKGYGKAVHPENMRTQDYQLAVGRSWENRPKEGPKMVNTVVGLQNGDWMRSTKKLKKQQQQLDKQVDELEKLLDEIAVKIELQTQKRSNYVKGK